MYAKTRHSLIKQTPPISLIEQAAHYIIYKPPQKTYKPSLRALGERERKKESREGKISRDEEVNRA